MARSTKKISDTLSGNTQQLSRELIAETALDLIDQDGLVNFSIRNLANRLGVYPTAIYWYIPNRNEILAQTMALVLKDLVPTVQRRSWQKFLRDIFYNFREAIRKHPNVAPLIDSQVTSNADLSLDLMEKVLSNLIRAGLEGESLVAGYNSTMVALVAYAAQEFAPIPNEGRDAFIKHVTTRVSMINAADHPNLSKNLPLLSNRVFTLRWQNGTDAPMDASYEAYVEIVISGIEKLSEIVASKKTLPSVET